MIAAVVFDLDGTLLDSVDLNADCWREAFWHFGKDVPFAKIRARIGRGGGRLVQEFLAPLLPSWLSKAEAHRLASEIERYRSELWLSHYLSRVRAFPGVRDLFLRIRGEGQKIALAAAVKREQLWLYEEIANVAGLADVEATLEDVYTSLPGSGIFHAALARFRVVERERAIAVLDSPWDARAAARAGIDAVGLRCGGFPESDLLAAGCVRVYHDPLDLLSNYEGSPIAFSADTPRRAPDLPPAIEEPQPPIVRSTEYPPEPMEKTDPPGPF